MSHEGWHERYDDLSESTRDLHRAIISLMEELEAIDWYQQRADVTPNDDLKAVLEHNRDEEIEHAVMTLEWIRRRVPKFDVNCRTYLFTKGPITEVEAKAEGKDGGGGGSEESGSDDEGGSNEAGSNDSKSSKSGEGGMPVRIDELDRWPGGSPNAARPQDGSLGVGSLKLGSKG